MDPDMPGTVRAIGDQAFAGELCPVLAHVFKVFDFKS
jgi:hypothetical protein